MRKSRFTESQIVEILKQGEAGVPIAEIRRQHNISKATYFQWRAKYAGASVAELMNETWVPDALYGGRPFRALTVIDKATGRLSRSKWAPPSPAPGSFGCWTSSCGSLVARPGYASTTARSSPP